MTAANRKSLGFVVYPAADLERAKAFYRDVVGLGKPSMLYETWAEFDLGNATFCVVTGGEDFAKPGSAFSAAFEVDDYDAAVKRLRESGANVFNEFDGPTCHAAFVRDSEGNGFSIHKLKS